MQPVQMMWPGSAQILTGETPAPSGGWLESGQALPAHPFTMPGTGYQVQEALMANGVDFSSWHAMNQLPVQQACGPIHMQQSSNAISDSGCVQPGSEMPAQVPVQESMNQHVHALGEAPTTTIRSQTLSRSALRRRRRQRAAKAAAHGEATHLQPYDDDESDAGTLECATNTVMPESSLADTEAAQAQHVARNLLEQLSASGQERDSAIARFRKLAFADQMSSRAAQLALMESSAKDAADLAFGLRGHVRDAIRSMYANYVVQKLVEVMPTNISNFVAKEMLGVAGDIARHRFGCRVLCRLLEHNECSDPAIAELYEEVLNVAETLCTHSFGSFVIGHFLEFGSPQHRSRVVQAVRKDTYAIAADKRGSHIVEAILQLASPDDKKGVANDLLASEEQLLFLAHNQFGCHVVKSLVRLPEYRQRAASLLCPHSSQLRVSKYGRHVLALMDAVAL